MGTHFGGKLLDALIFDVDGTLYDQTPVRRGMIWRLLRAHLRRPAQGLTTFHALRAYRKAQEFMRTVSLAGENLSDAQIRLASKWTGIRKETVA